MEAKQKLKDLAVSETGFVFDPHTGNSYNTNETGRAILLALQEGLAREAVIMALMSDFETTGDDLERDLDEFLFLLRENGVLPSHFTL
jgi:hypothetical protein